MCPMSDTIESPTRTGADGEDPSVLANLPRTRPQRSTPRRAAARREAAQKRGPTAPQDTGPDRPTAQSARPAAAGKTARRSVGKGQTTKSAAPGRSAAPGKGATPGKSAAPSRGAAPSGRTRKATSTAGTAPKRVKSASERRKVDRRRSAEHEPVPSQGYASEEDAATGAVQPPGGAELFMSAAEIVGELAKAGLSTGERLLKDALSRLPLS
jgi:hypothetical protein